MALKVHRKPVVTEFTLSADPDGETKVIIRQANQGDTLRRADLFAKSTRVIEVEDADGTIKYQQEYNVWRQRRYEVFLTLCGAPGIEDEDGKELFPSKETKDGPRLKMSEHEFNKAWDDLPPSVAKEIHDYVLDVNPQWDPNAEGE